MTNKKTDELTQQNGKHGSFTDPRDGKTYKTVKIGEQIWLAENFSFTEGIPQIRDAEEWEKLGDNDKYAAWCYYQNKAENGKKFGILYTWAAALELAPEGWHLPTQEEFESLINYFGDEEEAYQALIKGGNSDWTFLLAGWRRNNGNFGNKDYYSGFWSASEQSDTKAWYCYLEPDYEHALTDFKNKSNGYSVRLIKN